MSLLDALLLERPKVVVFSANQEVWIAIRTDANWGSPVSTTSFVVQLITAEVIENEGRYDCYRFPDAGIEERNEEGELVPLPEFGSDQFVNELTGPAEDTLMSACFQRQEHDQYHVI
jgi:hypothetical protein